MSETKIKDGTGTGNQAGVTSTNRLLTQSNTVSSELQAAIDETAHNLNTGDIALTDGTVTSALMYFKNTDTNTYILKALAVGQNTKGGTVNNGSVVTLVRNPTSMSVSNAAAQIGNRNFASSAVASTRATITAGEQGATFTGGSDTAQFYMGGGNRLFAAIDFVLPQGSSVGVKFLGNNTGAVDVYAALIGYWEA